MIQSRTTVIPSNYTNITEELSSGNISADIALICKPVAPTSRITLGGVSVDLDNMSAQNADGEDIHFTPTEFAMLTYLMKNASRAVPRKRIVPNGLGLKNDSSTRVADDTVKRLHKKLQKYQFVY